MPLLEVTDLDKTFTVDNRSVTAIDRLSLAIDEHEFVSIVGPSGCGKSTFLHILGGFEPATAGDLRLNGRPVGPPGPDRGMMFQELSLFPWLTAIENVAWPLEMKGLPKRERLPGAPEFVVGGSLHRDGYRTAVGSLGYSLMLEGQEGVTWSQWLASACPRPRNISISFTSLASPTSIRAS